MMSNEDKLQQVLRCAWEIQDCREWGKSKKDGYWPIQTEMDWALELQRVVREE